MPLEYSFHLPSSQVNVEDTLPLTQPVRTASGEDVTSIFVAKGQVVRIPVIAINMSEELWGNDAGTFDPKRWLVNEGGGCRSAEIQGYKHLLTFANGPRMCLGRNFAVTEIKVRGFSIYPGSNQLCSSSTPWLLGRLVRFSTALQL